MQPGVDRDDVAVAREVLVGMVRRRAGTRMAQAFISVLVDPHGVAAGLDPALRASIAELRERALDHLDTMQAPPIVEQAEKDEE